MNRPTHFANESARARFSKSPTLVRARNRLLLPPSRKGKSVKKTKKYSKNIAFVRISHIIVIIIIVFALVIIYNYIVIIRDYIIIVIIIIHTIISDNETAR